MKRIKCLTSAGYTWKPKWRQKKIQVLIPEIIPFLVDLANLYDCVQMFWVSNRSNIPVQKNKIYISKGDIKKS